MKVYLVYSEYYDRLYNYEEKTNIKIFQNKNDALYYINRENINVEYGKEYFIQELELI